MLRRNPPLKDLLIKMSLHANWVFLHTLFLENEAQIDRNNYGTMLFMSKQVSVPKISSILQKMKIGQNSIYALFARSPSIMLFLSCCCSLFLLSALLLIRSYLELISLCPSLQTSNAKCLPFYPHRHYFYCFSIWEMENMYRISMAFWCKASSILSL